MTYQSRMPDPRPRAATAQEADMLVGAALSALDALEPVIVEETTHLKEGRLHQALELSARKNPAAQRYQRALQDIKANAIALGRFAPPSLSLLKERHEVFSEALALNMAVLGTAKMVSESIVRELAVDVGQAGSPQGYGLNGQPKAGGYRTPAAHLAVSKTL
jgi:hypothetical protein